MIRAQAYVKKQRLIVLGVADLESGPIPFSYSTAIEDQVSDGPVDFGAELPPAIEHAMAKGEEKIAGKIQGEKMKLAAEELVIRSRQGDQNAMAILGAIRGRAQRGDQRARAAFRIVHDYIKRHPPDADFAGTDKQNHIQQIERFANEKKDPLKRAIGVQIFAPSLPIERAVVLLASGPQLSPNYVRNVLAPYPNPEVEMGMQHSRAQTSKKPEFRAGQIIGRAKRLQQIRLAQVPFKIMSPGVAWELGEK